MQHSDEKNLHEVKIPNVVAIPSQIHIDPQEEKLINEAEQVRRLFDVDASTEGSKR